MGTTTATVLRRLDALESALGTKLFDRQQNGLRERPACALAKPWAQKATTAALAMLQEVTDIESKPVGNVRLAVPPAVASLFLIPELPRFRARHPEITLDFVASTAIVDLSKREADLAIRTSKPEIGELVVQRLARYQMVVVRSPDLTLPKGWKVADGPWLGWDPSLSRTPSAQWLSMHAPDAKIVMRSTELGTLIAAAQRGLGLLALPEFCALKAGGLVTLRLPGIAPGPPEGAVWLVAHQALRRVARVAAVWDWVVKTFAVPAKPSRRPSGSRENASPTPTTPRNG